jgi:thioredoxin-related protein
MKTLTIIALLAFTAPVFAQNTVAKKETVKIYNPQADARKDIDAAVAKAKKEGKHVFLQVGGNWCGWCIAFHQMIDQTPELKSLLDDNYEVVLVNYSPENKNEAVLASLGYPQRFGFPVFLVLDGNGKLLHTQNSAYLETDELDAQTGRKKTGHDIKEVSTFLKGWTVKALDPATYKVTKAK